MIEPNSSPGDSTKAALRATMKAARRGLTPDERSALSVQACAHLRRYLADLAPRMAAALFAPFGAEADPSALERELTRVAYPRVEEPGLRFAWCRQADLESAGRIREPPVQAPTASWSDLDVVVVPGLAFDAEGHRVGYGRAYYDRALERARQAHPRIRCVGFAFAFQRVESIPREPHDQPLDGLVTEAGLSWFV